MAGAGGWKVSGTRRQNLRKDKTEERGGRDEEAVACVGAVGHGQARLHAKKRRSLTVN